MEEAEEGTLEKLLLRVVDDDACAQASLRAQSASLPVGQEKRDLQLVSDLFHCRIFPCHGAAHVPKDVTDCSVQGPGSFLLSLRAMRELGVIVWSSLLRTMIASVLALFSVREVGERNFPDALHCLAHVVVPS